MTLFGVKLTEVENRIFANVEKTKSTFPEETRLIELGLALMREVTHVSQDAINNYKTRPNLPANHNLFARNRQLLLNAYFCMLNSSYGTQFVILRTVLENNNLMRLFNKKPQSAFEWLSKDAQKRFSEETMHKYDKSGKQNRTFEPGQVRREVFFEKGKVRDDIRQFYDGLCNYTHPNFVGWQELVERKGQTEIMLNMPRFQLQYADRSIGVTLFLMQLTFKTFVETFKGCLLLYALQLEMWQDNFHRLIVRYTE
jgi:hypothetical protein